MNSFDNLTHKTHKNRWQGSCGQHRAHMGPVGPSWAPCWHHKLLSGKTRKPSISRLLTDSLHGKDCNTATHSITFCVQYVTVLKLFKQCCVVKSSTMGTLFIVCRHKELVCLVAITKLDGLELTFCSYLASMWLSNAAWRRRSGSTLTQVMAYCLVAPRHYLDQSWRVTCKVQ